MSHTERLHALDAVRGFALLMGLVLHGAFFLHSGHDPRHLGLRGQLT